MGERETQKGVLNAITPADLESTGFAQILVGTSYVQVVTWKDGQLVAKVLLAHGQSFDPTSAHYADQLPLFAKKQLDPAAFTEQEIEADPNLEVLRLSKISHSRLGIDGFSRGSTRLADNLNGIH